MARGECMKAIETVQDGPSTVPKVQETCVAQVLSNERICFRSYCEENACRVVETEPCLD